MLTMLLRTLRKLAPFWTAAAPSESPIRLRVVYGSGEPESDQAPGADAAGDEEGPVLLPFVRSEPPDRPAA